jgi:NADPH-dependent curcumin reductase CurA
LVSSAAGATGSVAGQIAKARGCRVIGIAGGVEKCRLLTEHYGFDSAIDYKNSDVAAQLTELAPQGVDVYFDNVGLPILDQVLAKIRIGARVVLCGGISSGYTGDRPSLGVTNYMQLVIRRATMQGFLVLDYVDEYATARTELASMLGDASLVVHEDCLHGIESCPEALAGLFAGANVGKQLVLLDHGEVE